MGLAERPTASRAENNTVLGSCRCILIGTLPPCHFGLGPKSASVHLPAIGASDHNSGVKVQAACVPSNTFTGAAKRHMWDDVHGYLDTVKRAYRRDNWQTQPNYCEV